MDKLFKDLGEEPKPKSQAKKEDPGLDSISELKNKLALVIEKVKSLKQEKADLETRVRELESLLDDRDEELRMVSSDKLSIKDQIADLLNELETIETG
jgi:chromosome segregation ATPase